MSVTAHPFTIRLGQWIAGQRGPETGVGLLDRRRVYILPTTPGVVFGAAMLVLLIGSINYSLQLGYMLTFLVTSMAVVGMHTTHANLAQIVLRGVRVEPVFAGDVAIFEITATNPTTVDRFALRFSFIDPTVVRAGFRCSQARRADDVGVDRGTGARRPQRRRPTDGTGARPAARAARRHRDPLSVRFVACMGLPDSGTDRDGLSGAGDRRTATAGDRLGGGDGVGLASSGDDFAGVRPYTRAIRRR